MIGLALSLLLLSSAPGGAGGEILAPGSLEDCLAWSMADLESAAQADKQHRSSEVSRLMGQHFMEMIERGAPTAEIIRRQRRLHRIAQTRLDPGEGQAERAVCAKNFPTPTWPKKP